MAKKPVKKTRNVKRPQQRFNSSTGTYETVYVDVVETYTAYEDSGSGGSDYGSSSADFGSSYSGE